MSRQIEATMTEASARNLSISATIELLADLELESRQGRAIERRFKCSRLQSQPSIDAFHFHHHKSRVQAKNRILRLLDLTFLRQGTNLVLIGNPGVGKTFLARVFGWKACQANQRVLFTTAMDMLNHLLASQVDHSLVRKLKTYTEPALLIVDECEVVSNVELGVGSSANRSSLAAQLHI
jgi:DNA replication protein DnaC